MRLRLVFFPFSAFVCLLSPAAHTQTNAQQGVGFAMIGIASGQSARVNAVNLAPQDSANTSCSVTLQFLDVQGQPLKQSTINLLPGKAVSLDLRHDSLP